MSTEHMIFTVTDHEGRHQTFEGFKRYSIPCRLKDGQFLAIVEWAADPEIWVVEGNGLEELGRYYRSEFGIDFHETRVITTHIITTRRPRRAGRRCQPIAE